MDIQARIQSALDKSRAAWSARDHDADERVVARMRLCERVRAQFLVSLCNLQSFHAFWEPYAEKLLARSTKRTVAEAYQPSRGRGGAVPASAVYVGTYTTPFSPDQFLEDLDDHIALIRSA